MSGLILPGGGVWELIGKATANADASVGFSWAGQAYRKVLLLIGGALPVIDDVEAFIRTSTDGGSTYDSGASDYGWTVFYMGGGITPNDTDDPSGSEIKITATAATDAVGDTAGQELSGAVEIIFPDELVNTVVLSQVRYDPPTGNHMMAVGTASRKSAANVDGIQFLFESGNIASGEFACYGLI